MAFAIENLLARSDFDVAAVNRVLAVMEQHPLKDHFSIGVLNNGTVTDKLSSVFSATRKRIACSTSLSKDEQSLHDQVERLLAIVNNSSYLQRGINYFC